MNCVLFYLFPLSSSEQSSKYFIPDPSTPHPERQNKITFSMPLINQLVSVTSSLPTVIGRLHAGAIVAATVGAIVDSSRRPVACSVYTRGLLSRRSVAPTIAATADDRPS